MEFCTRLKKLRNQKGISQEKLASEIHISRSAVAKWENGLGLPNDESLKMLSDYFSVSIEELLPNEDSEQKIITKNKIISKQKKIIIFLSLIICVSLMIVLIYFCKPIRKYAMPILLGIIITAFGVFNFRGNIASIHWYNRRKVTKENQKPYCRLMGIGTVIIGAGITVFAVLQSFMEIAFIEYMMTSVIVIGLGIMLVAQIKYNKGIF